MTRIFAAIALLCALIAPANAQKTKAALNTEIGVNFPDNSVGSITPSILRTTTADIVNSIMPTAPVVSGNLACFNGTTGLLQDCGSAPTGFISSITGDCTAASNGIITCTKTNGSAFVASATSDTTIATNIISGTLASARLPSPFTSGTASGNTSKFATASGSLINGNCAKFDASGNIVDNGSSCGTSGQYILLNTLTASNSTVLSDVTSLTASFSIYDIVFENVLPATNATSCELQIHSSGAFKNSGYVASGYGNANGGAMAFVNPTTFVPCSLTSDASNAESISGTVRIYNPSAASKHSAIGTFGYINGGAATYSRLDVGGLWNTAGAVDGFQVLMAAGNITSGVIKIYGIQ